MNKPTTQLLLLAAVVAFIGCNNSAPAPTVFQERGTPAFMYASNEGEIRFLNIETVEGDTNFVVSRATNIGRNLDQFGSVAVDSDFKLDWSPFEDDQDPRIAAVLKQQNRLHQPNLGPRGRFFHQVVSVSENGRLSKLSYFSEAANQQRVIDDSVHTSGAFAKSVDYINNNSFLVFHLDRLDDPLENDPFKALGLVLRFTVESNGAFNSEIVRSFDVTNSPIDSDSLGIETRPFKYSRFGKISASANGEFYVLWASVPPFDFTRQPYVIRENGTIVLDPENFTPKDFRNVPGVITNQYEPHPTRDSLFAVVDYSTAFANGAETNGFHILKLPVNSNSWFDVLHTLKPNRIMNTNLMAYPEIWRKRSMFISYSPLGDRVAILHAISSEEPSLSIWFPEEDKVTQFDIDPSLNINSVRKPAWYAEDPSKVFFTAGDSVADVANIYYVDSDKNGGVVNKIDWDDDIEFLNVPADDALREVRELVGREIPQP